MTLRVLPSLVGWSDDTLCSYLHLWDGPMTICFPSSVFPINICGGRMNLTVCFLLDLCDGPMKLCVPSHLSVLAGRACTVCVPPRVCGPAGVCPACLHSLGFDRWGVELQTQVVPHGGYQGCPALFDNTRF